MSIEFPFPFTPYDVQQEFMESLFRTVDDGDSSVAILESPTGTGKSLSIIVSALHWLYDRWPTRMKEEMKAQVLGELSVSEPSWIAEHLLQTRHDERLRLIDSKRKVHETKKRRHVHVRDSTSDDVEGDSDSVEIHDSEYLIDWTGNEETSGVLDGAESASDDNNDDGDDDTPQIIYCSRTHSQLSQFVQEIKKTVYRERVQCVSLGSRKNMCINPSVTKLKSVALMNDACLDMKSKGNNVANKKTKVDAQKSHVQTSRTSGCPYLGSMADQKAYAEKVVVNLHDMEELVSLGRKSKTCPYYGTRHAVKHADVITLPYTSLLHASTREALGVKLRNRIVIIDEAHNLIETINEVHSAHISVHELLGAHTQLQQYANRYERRLKASNLLRIQQVLYLLDALRKYIEKVSLSTVNNDASHVMTVSDFVFEACIDNVNLFSLQRFIVESRLVQKLHGFADRYLGDTDTADTVSNPNHPVYKQVSWLGRVTQFMTAVSNAEEDGRVILLPPSCATDSPSLKFLMLNPAVNFQSIVDSARAVILAGGTMKPFEHFVHQLFTKVPTNNLHTLSCNHVVDPTNVLAVTVSSGPSGLDFDFRYNARSVRSRVVELGRLLVNVCNIVPDGVVCFFPSYAYEEHVFNVFSEEGIVNAIKRRKQVFRESRSHHNTTDTLLTDYYKCVNSGKGALLMSVIGGKMSEGINFSDSLARCVVVVGMPYPNPNDAILKEKMRYLDATIQVDNNTNDVSPGHQYYENLCMRAVNQSIGRSIRHRNDFAAILLVDQRYSNKQVYSMLPQWIRDRLHHANTFGAAFAPLAQFVRNKHNKK